MVVNANVLRAEGVVMNEAEEPGGFTLVSKMLGGLPIVNDVIERLRLPELLTNALPGVDGRVKLAPAVLIRLVITNLVVGRESLYGLGEWAGRALVALFDADRGSLSAAGVLRAISEFAVDTS